jgi:hypothetical protein|tara:strand:- start:23 stop:403 length:381 start_codon:yes stop_codon:yes gene_type:complete
MTTQQATVPDTWKGSDVAYVAYEALIRAGKEPGRDFSYQSRTQGRRLESSLEVDFSFQNPPNLAMQIQESLYSHPGGIETRGTDVLARAQLAGQGVTLIMLSHEKLQQDPDWLISEALQYRDHSWE